MEGTGKEGKADRRRVIVVTDPLTADGFDLSGVEVRSFSKAEPAARAVERLIEDATTDVIIVNEEFLSGVGPAAKSRIESSELPVVIALPHDREAPGHVRMESLVQFIHRSKGQV